jgi:hypothetical protein
MNRLRTAIGVLSTATINDSTALVLPIVALFLSAAWAYYFGIYGVTALFGDPNSIDYDLILASNTEDHLTLAREIIVEADSVIESLRRVIGLLGSVVFGCALYLAIGAVYVRRREQA